MNSKSVRVVTKVEESIQTSWKELCSDQEVACDIEKIKRQEFASNICQDKWKDEENVVGTPVIHSEEELSQACKIFCKSDRITNWTPLDNGHFPDGTWCHTQNKTHFFCLNGDCVSS